MISLYLYDYIIIQLVLTLYLTIASVSYFLTFHPYEDKLTERLDIMNDVVTLLLVDVCFMFTDYESNLKIQYNFGYVFCILFSACIFVHLVFLFIDISKTLKYKFKMCLKRK